MVSPATTGAASLGPALRSASPWIREHVFSSLSLLEMMICLALEILQPPKYYGTRVLNRTTMQGKCKGRSITNKDNFSTGNADYTLIINRSSP